MSTNRRWKHGCAQSRKFLSQNGGKHEWYGKNYSLTENAISLIWLIADLWKLPYLTFKHFSTTWPKPILSSLINFSKIVFWNLTFRKSRLCSKMEKPRCSFQECRIVLFNFSLQIFCLHNNSVVPDLSVCGYYCFSQVWLLYCHFTSKYTQHCSVILYFLKRFVINAISMCLYMASKMWQLNINFLSVLCHHLYCHHPGYFISTCFQFLQINSNYKL